MVNTLLNKNVFRIGCFALDEEEFGRKRPRLRKLLGAIVYQAIHDRMWRVRIGVDRSTGHAFMRYFGPHDLGKDKQCWWKMVPPPAECYPAMVQLCLSLARLQPGLPFMGVIPAVMNRKKFNTDLLMNDIDSIEISWKIEE